jgi:hypothetical protein
MKVFKSIYKNRGVILFYLEIALITYIIIKM